MRCFKFWAAVYAACASLPLFAHAVIRGEGVWLVLWWALALLYSISIALMVASDWIDMRGVRVRNWSVYGRLLPSEYLEMRLAPPTELSDLDREAAEWETGFNDKEKS